MLTYERYISYVRHCAILHFTPPLTKFGVCGVEVVHTAPRKHEVYEGYVA